MSRCAGKCKEVITEQILRGIVTQMYHKINYKTNTRKMPQIKRCISGQEVLPFTTKVTLYSSYKTAEQASHQVTQANPEALSHLGMVNQIKRSA